MRWAGARSAAWPTCCRAHRDLANPEHRAEVARAVGRGRRAGHAGQDARWRCSRPRPTARSRRCGSPAPTRRSRCPTRPRCAARCERAEFVVLQEAYADTATAAFADLLLPASTWGEKDGTVTNSERRISRVRAAVPPPGEARARLAHRASTSRGGWKRGCRRGAADGAHAVPLRHAEAIWNEHRDSTRGRDLDITGLSYAAAGRQPQQWPLPAGATRRPRRACTPTAASPPPTAARASSHRPGRPLAEPRDARFPLSLTTGRLRDQWHGMSRTGTLGRLFAPQRRTRARTAPAGPGAAPLGRRRPGARAARAAARWCCRCSASAAVRAGAGLHRHALGRRSYMAGAAASTR